MAVVFWTFILVPNLCVLISEITLQHVVVVVVVVVGMFFGDVDLVGKADLGGQLSCSILGSVMPWAGVGRTLVIGWGRVACGGYVLVLLK